MLKLWMFNLMYGDKVKLIHENKYTWGVYRSISYPTVHQMARYHQED